VKHIKFLNSEGHTVDIAGERYVWNHQGNGDTIEMPNAAAKELLEGPGGADFEEVAEPETKPAKPAKAETGNPLSPANSPTTFGPAPTSEAAAPTTQADKAEKSRRAETMPQTLPTIVTYTQYPFGAADSIWYHNELSLGGLVLAGNVPGLRGPKIKSMTHKTTLVVAKIVGNDAVDRTSSRIVEEEADLEFEAGVNNAWLSFITGGLWRTAGTTPAGKALYGNKQGQVMPTIAWVVQSLDDLSGATSYGAFNSRLIDLPGMVAEYTKFGTVRKMKVSINPDTTADKMFLRTLQTETFAALDPSAAPILIEA
jgi:hypothetical protein